MLGVINIACGFELLKLMLLSAITGDYLKGHSRHELY